MIVRILNALIVLIILGYRLRKRMSIWNQSICRRRPFKRTISLNFYVFFLFFFHSETTCRWQQMPVWIQRMFFSMNFKSNLLNQFPFLYFTAVLYKRMSARIQGNAVLNLSLKYFNSYDFLNIEIC